MTFTPHSAVLKFPKLGTLDAPHWLYRVMGRETFADLRRVILTDELPSAPPAAQGKPILAGEPIVPVARCPETGRPLRLFLFRDLSCALYRDGPEGGAGWEVLPAYLSLSADIWHESLRSTPYNERHRDVPRVKLQSRAQGIHWSVVNGEITRARLEEILVAAMEETARIILAHKPLADPRVHETIPEGARFAPYCRFPAASTDHPAFQRLEVLTRCLALTRAQQAKCSYAHVSLRRKLIHDPWRQPTDRDLVEISVKSQGVNGFRDPKLAKALRFMLRENIAGLPDNLRFGTESDTLLSLDNIGDRPTRHDVLAATSRAGSDADLQRLLAQLE